MKIQLTQGYETEIDDEDWDRVKDYKWRACKGYSTFYVQASISVNKKETQLYMHRLIMNAPSNLVVDHIDGDGLNNKKENLRLCTTAQNGMNKELPKNNSSGFKGVYYNATKKKWVAQIGFKRKNHNLGSYRDPVTAAKAYDAKAKELFGEFAWLNFPDV